MCDGRRRIVVVLAGVDADVDVDGDELGRWQRVSNGIEGACAVMELHLSWLKFWRRRARQATLRGLAAWDLDPLRNYYGSDIHSTAAAVRLLPSFLPLTK